jgi:hypothetical protein
MALNTLYEILKERGSEYVDRLLSDNVIITEKLDTYRILFEKVNGDLKFFKKDNTELGLIERVLTNIWEDAIVELSIILNEKNLPEGIRFGLAYTPIDKPIRLNYKNLPKYILTDMTERSDNKVKKIYEYDEVFKWAEELCLGRPPIIFEGKLSADQKKILLDYASGNWDDMEEDSLSEVLEKHFNGTYSKENTIEGVIIKNNDRLSQIISYEFNILNEAYQKIEGSRDFYDLTILSLNSFFDHYNFPVLEGESPDSLYLEMVCDIFNNYCYKNSIAEQLKPEYLTPPRFGYTGELNTLLIKNKKTLELLESGGKVYESLFKVILSSLRKYKKEFGLLNESAVSKFNTFVYFINEKSKKPIEIPQIEPVEIIDESRSDNIVIDAVNKKMNKDIDNMRVIASIQKTFEPKGDNIQKGKEKCVVYFSDFRPFTKSQEENILSMNKMWKCPVILASVTSARRTKGTDFKFSDNLIKSQIKAFADFNKEIVPAYFMIDDWDLYSVFHYCRPKYEPIAIITDEGKKSDFVLQLYFEEEVMSQRIGVEKDLNIGEMENKDYLAAFRTIEDNIAYEFNNLTPQPIHGLFDTMQSELRTWQGLVFLK